MSDDVLTDMHSAHVAASSKYTYFILAAAGAAIGFAVQKTEGMKISWWLLPVGLAVLSWAVSFYYGCKSALRAQHALASNIAMLQMRRGSSLTFQPPAHQLPQFLQALMTATTKYGDEAFRAGKLQFAFLVIGGALFLGWRIAEMIRIS